MRTYVATPKTIDSRWHVIDADGQVLGRIATVAARLLQGKHKVTYTPFIDTGDHVVIVNAAKVKLTGRKEEQKLYRRHSGYEAVCAKSAPRSSSARRPACLRGVHVMLPRLRSAPRCTATESHAGPDHPHMAQKPSAREVA